MSHYRCADCNTSKGVSCDNGDGEKRCEECAVKKYKTVVPYYIRNINLYRDSVINLKKLLESS